MAEFFQIAFSFPTVVFSAILMVLAAYWTMVILGALDLDFADFDIDFDVDTDLGIEMGVDVGADGDFDIDGDVGADGVRWSVFAALASALGLGTVPVTVILSFLTLCAWLVSFASVYYLMPILGGWSALVAAVLGLGSFAVALAPTIAIMHPLKHLFDPQEGPSGGRGLVGTVCIVSTSRVDRGFGRAKVADDGAGLILPVRCENASNRLTHGSKAVIIDYDSVHNSYMVESYELFLGDDASGKARALSDNIARAADESDRRNAQDTQDADEDAEKVVVKAKAHQQHSK